MPRQRRHCGCAVELVELTGEVDARGRFEFKRVDHDVNAAAREIVSDPRLSDSFDARLFAGV